MSELPAWPEPLRLPDDNPTAWLGLSHKYNRELADAAMARLKVAVEALKDAQDVFDRNTNSQRSPFTAQVYAIQKVLHAIGEIPEA
jgi:hypothetical protein